MSQEPRTEGSEGKIVLNKHQLDQPSLTFGQVCIRRLFSLRLKTMATLVFIFLIAMAVFLAVLLSVFKTTFSKLEVRVTRDASARVSRSVNDDFQGQLARTMDYAAWEYTYWVMRNGTQFDKDEFMTSGFYCSFMQVYKLNFVALYTAEGQLASYSACDIENGTEINFPAELNANFTIDHPLMKNIDNRETRLGGFIVESETQQIILVTAAPVQHDTSDDTHGIIVYGRYLATDMIQDIANRAQLCTTFRTLTSIDDPLVKAYRSRALNSKGTIVELQTTDWEQNSAFLVEPLRSSHGNMLSDRECWSKDSGRIGASNPRIASYQVFNDLFGEKVVLVRSDVPRYIDQLGMNSFGLSYGMVCFVAILMSIAVILFVEIFVLRPVLSLGSDVREITEKNDISKRVKKTSTDEIGDLTLHVNCMLDALDHSQTKLKNEHAKLQQLLQKIAIEEQRFRSVMNAIPDYILTIRCSDGVLLNANNTFYAKLRYSPHDVDGQLSISTLFKSDGLASFLDQLSLLSVNNQSMDTIMNSRMNRPIPVKITVNKTKLFLGDQIVDAFVMVSRNMKEQQQIQETLKHHNNQLQALTDNVEFDSMLRNPILREEFREYCVKEQSSENFAFLEAVEEFRSMKLTHERVEMQDSIIQNYLMVGSPRELNISNSVREEKLFEIQKGLGQIDVFDSLESVIRTMVISDTFRRFKSQKEEYSKKL